MTPTDEIFDYVLAALFRRPDVDRFLSEMPNAQYVKWKAAARYLFYLQNQARGGKPVPADVMGLFLSL